MSKQTKLAWLALTAVLGIGIVAQAAIVDQDTAMSAASGFLSNSSVAKRVLAGCSVENVEQRGSLWIVHLAPSGYIEVAGSTKCAPILSFSSYDFAEPEVGSPFAAKLTGDSMMVAEKEADESLEDNADWAKYTAPVVAKRVLLGAAPSGTDGTGYDSFVAPMLGATWHQTAPYNDLSPYNYFCGCMATAAGQELRYWRWPYRYEKFRQSTHGVRDAQFNYSDFVIRPNGLVPFNWDKVVASAPNPASTPWAADKEATYNTAWLSLWAQSLTGMGYKPGGSGGTRQLAGTAEEYWYEKGKGYTYWNDGYEALWAAVKADLDWGSPIQINTAAHQMVIDGYAVENYGEENEVDWINLNLGYGNATYWDNLRTAVTEGTYSGTLASFQTGFRPQKIVQFEPVPKVSTSDVTLKWHIAPCYTSRTTGFTIEIAKEGGATTSDTVSTHEETTTYTATGLDVGGTYTFTVTPVMSEGEGEGRSNSVTTTIGEPKAAPEFLSVSSVACGIELLQQDIFIECAYGSVNKIDLTCSESTTAVVPYSSHLTILPDSKLSVTKNGNVFTVNVDATAMDPKWSGEMLVLTLVAKNEDGTEACKNLMLRFNSMRQVINGTFDAADGDNNSAVWFCGDTTIDAKGRAVSFGASAFQGTGKVTLTDSVGGGSFTFAGLDNFKGTLVFSGDVDVTLPSDMTKFEGTLSITSGTYTLSNDLPASVSVTIANGVTLNLDNAKVASTITGAGTVSIASGSSVLSGAVTSSVSLSGGELTIPAGTGDYSTVSVGGGTLKIQLTQAQSILGYDWWLPFYTSGSVKFVLYDGTEVNATTTAATPGIRIAHESDANVWTGTDYATFGETYSAKWANGLPSEGDYVIFKSELNDYMGTGTDEGTMMALNLTAPINLGYVLVKGTDKLEIGVYSGATSALLSTDVLENEVETHITTTYFQPKAVIPHKKLSTSSGFILSCELDSAYADNLKKHETGGSALPDANYWRGTVLFCNRNVSNLEISNYGNAQSRIRFNGVTGSLLGDKVFEGTLELVDYGESPALNINAGSTEYSVTIGSVVGNGTFKISGETSKMNLLLKDISGWTGSFDLASKTVAIGQTVPSAYTGVDGRLHICQAVTVADGATWKAAGGLYLGADGALTVNGAVEAKNVTTYGSGASITLEDGAVLQVEAASVNDNVPTLNFKAGTFRVQEGADAFRETATINFCAASGKRTVIDANGATLTLGPKVFSGSGDVYLTSSKEGGKIIVEGVPAAYTGKIYCDISCEVSLGDLSKATDCTIDVSDIIISRSSSDIGNFTIGSGASLEVTVNKQSLIDGCTIDTVTLVSGGTLVLKDKAGQEIATFNEEDAVDGKYILEADSTVTPEYILDYEFNGNLNSEISGRPNLVIYGGGSGSYYENTELYTKSVPYITDETIIPADEWTAFIRCVMPENASTIVLMFGATGGNIFGLVSGSTENTVALVYNNAIIGEAVSVANAATMRHVYAIVKTANRVRLYVDGELKLDESITLAVARKFQIGSVHGGNNSAYASCNDTVSRIDYLKFYDFAVGQSIIDDEVQEPDPTTLTVTPGTGEVEFGTEVVAKSNDSTARIMYKKSGDADYTEYTAPIVLNVSGLNIYNFQVRDADDNVVVDDIARYYNVAEEVIYESPTPVAVWHGDFTAEQAGYTLELNGNSLSSDKKTITIDQSVGVVVTNNTGTFTGGYTVLFKYSNLNLSLATRQVLAATKLTDSNNRVGAEINASGKACGIWAGNSWNDSGTYNTMTSDQTSGVLAYTHYSTSGNNGGGTGTQLFCLKDNKLTTIMDASTLGSTGDVSKYKGFSVGGPVATITGASAATDMQITGIVVFEGVLTEGSIKAYVWPTIEPEPEPEYEGPDPVAVWVAGEFGDDKSAHGGCEFALNDNTIDGSGNIVIGNSTTLGATIAVPNYDNVTMLVKYEIPSGGAPAANSVPVSVFVTKEMGALAGSGSSALDGYWLNGSNITAGYAFSSPAPSIPQQGYLLISVPANSNQNLGNHYTAAYVGETVSALSGGETSGLRFTGDNNRVTSIGVGGPTVAGAVPWAGMVIKSVALFDEWVTPSDLANYSFPVQGAVQPVDSDRYTIEPVVSWVNDFKTTTKGDYTLSVSGTTAAKDDTFGGTLTIGDAAAVVDVRNGANGGNVTVLVKYRATPATVNSPVVTFGETLSNSVKIDVGAYTQSARTLAVNRSWNGGNNKWVALNTSASLNEGEGYLLCARKSNDMMVYVGDSLDSMTGGSASTTGDITFTCDLIQAVGIGGTSGLPNADSTWSPFTGFVVEKVVVFNGYYTPDQIRYVENPEDGDTVNIADNTTWTFTASNTPREYTSVGTLSSSGTIAIANASELTEGTYPLATWTTPQIMSSGYGRVGTLTTEGLPEGLTAELVYGVKAIYLRVYDAAAYAARPKLKVWPYGDSITEGFNLKDTHANYRVLLGQKLAMLGYNVEMVGCYDKIQNYSGGAFVDAIDPSGATIPDAWKWHSAKHGSTLGVTALTSWQRSALTENVDTLSAQVGKPDVVLLLGGINDLSPGFDAPATVFANWTNVVTRLVSNLPTSKIIVTTTLHAGPGRTDSLNTNADGFNTLVKNYLNNEKPEAWEGHVYFVDLCDKVKSAETGVISSDNLHPDWLGDDQMADGWLEKIVELYPDKNGTFPSATALPEVTSEQLGAAAKSELADYIEGFQLCRTITPVGNIDTANPYTTTGEGATEGVEKVGYFVEYVRADNNAHKWVWVDMDTFGNADLASIGLPAANRQQVVTKLHVKSNHNGIEDVAANNDTVEGWIEFSPYDYTGNSSGVEGAPTAHGGNDKSMFDWNDKLSTSGSMGCMQVFRKSPATGRPAQVLFAYNNWRDSESEAEFGIGNCAQHFWGGAQTLDYTYTKGLEKLNASAYSVKRIEIWTKAAELAPVVAQIGEDTFTSLAEALETVTGDDPVAIMLVSASNENVNLPSNVTVTEESSNLYTGTLSGSGTLVLAGTRSAAMSFSNWTGTVELPQFTANGQVLTNYCNDNSKLKLNGITGGYLHWTDFSLNAEVILAGNFVLTDMSQRNYAFSKISGSGNISLSPGMYELTGFTIGELAEGYAGAITNNMNNTKIVITNLMLPANTSVTPGSKVLAVGGSQAEGVKVTNVKVGGVLQNVQLERRNKGQEGDGLYVKMQIDDQGEGTEQVITVITEPEQESVEVPVDGDFTGTIVVAPTVKSIDTGNVSVQSSQVQVKYGSTEITGAFSVSDNLELALKRDGVVEGVSVDPAIDTTAEAPVDMDAATPTIKVKAIPGLWYAVKSGTALGNEGVAGDTATSTPALCTALGTIQLTAPAKNGEDTMFYSIMVSTTESELSGN